MLAVATATLSLLAGCMLCTLPLPALATSWAPCAEGALKVDTVDVTPESPRHGDAMHVAIKGISSAEVPDGDLRVSVSYHGFHVYSSHSPLCSATSCPLQAGPVTIENDWKLPSLAPPGPYSIQLKGLDKQGTVFMCVDIKFSVSGGQPSMGVAAGVSSM